MWAGGLEGRGGGELGEGGDSRKIPFKGIRTRKRLQEEEET